MSAGGRASYAKAINALLNTIAVQKGWIGSSCGFHCLHCLCTWYLLCFEQCQQPPSCHLHQPLPWEVAQRIRNCCVSLSSTLQIPTTLTKRTSLCPPLLFLLLSSDPTTIAEARLHPLQTHELVDFPFFNILTFK